MLFFVQIVQTNISESSLKHANKQNICKLIKK